MPANRDQVKCGVAKEEAIATPTDIKSVLSLDSQSTTTTVI
jgi:hypothetical protein